MRWIQILAPPDRVSRCGHSKENGRAKNSGHTLTFLSARRSAKRLAHSRISPHYWHVGRDEALQRGPP